MTTHRASPAEGCKKSILDFAKKLCTPMNSLSFGYPWACRVYAPGEIEPDITGNNDTLMGKMANHAKDYCLRPSEKDMDELPTKVQADIVEVLTDLKYQMQMQLKQTCEDPYLHPEIGAGTWIIARPIITSTNTFACTSSNTWSGTWSENSSIQSCNDVYLESVSKLKPHLRPNCIDKTPGYLICDKLISSHSVNFAWGYCTK